MLFTLLKGFNINDSPWYYLSFNMLSDEPTTKAFVADFYDFFRFLSVGVIAITSLIEIIRWGVNAHEPLKNMPGRRSFLKTLAWKMILVVIILNLNTIYNYIFIICNLIRQALGS